MALGGRQGELMGMLRARIRDLIWPMQESASTSIRLLLSNSSAYRMTSKTAAESFWLASVDSAANFSRRSLAVVRIRLAVAACSLVLVAKIMTPGGWNWNW